jgi:hypothetical protein
MASGSTAPAQALMVSGPTARGLTWMVSELAGETETAASTLEALASPPVDLSKADLERLQAAKH